MEFIFFPVINEACRVVEERIVDKPSDLDVAAVLGMGFPPYRGGLIKFADLTGPKHIVQRLEVRRISVLLQVGNCGSVFALQAAG